MFQNNQQSVQSGCPGILQGFPSASFLWSFLVSGIELSPPKRSKTPIQMINRIVPAIAGFIISLLTNKTQSYHRLLK